MAAVTCLWDVLLRPALDGMVRPRETRYAVAVATNITQVRLIIHAARSIVERSPALAGLLEGVTEDELRFTLPSGARTAIKAFPCTSRGGRGFPISCLVMDESAHFLTADDGDRAADRVWEALAPSTAQFGDLARIIVSSTPYGEHGMFASLWQRAHAGEIRDALAQHATTSEMNPTVTTEFLAAEQARDPESFAAEFEACFTGSGDAFIDFDRIMLMGAPTARPEHAETWVAGLDPAFSRDPFGVALVGRAADGGLVVGPVLALDAQGDFSGPVDEAARVIGEYNATAVTDQFCQAPVVERLRYEHGLQVRVNTMSAQSKTEIFQLLRLRLYDGSLLLPDHPGLTGELRRLRTRYSAGSASILNPRVGGSHGDMAQALALAVGELGTAASPSPPILMSKDSRWSLQRINEAPQGRNKRRMPTTGIVGYGTGRWEVDESEVAPFVIRRPGGSGNRI
jgi:hypothetical protein